MILVTGATGTNGRLVVELLLRAGAAVRAMVQSTAKAADLAQAGAQVVAADLDKPETLRAALDGVERCLLLSAVDQRLVEREARFVEAAKKVGVRHLVKFSAIGAHPAASFLFGRQHGQAEQLVMASGLPFTLVQPTFFMQNLFWSAATIKGSGEFYGTLGGARASHVDARDIGRVIVTMLTEPIDRHAGRVHLITGPAAVTFAEIADTLSQVLAIPVRYVNLTDEQFKAGAIGSGQPEWLATALTELNIYARQGHSSVVTDTVERVTGRAPSTVEAWARENASALLG
jgi:uncharacterized protein YbjT (DUF2867 family)